MGNWDRAHRRYRLVHAAAEGFAARGSLEPWLPEIEAEYGDFDAFLRDVQVRYLRGIEARLENGSAIAEVAAAYPEMHRLLGAYAAHPALTEGHDRFRRSVLAVTGIDPGVPYEKGTPDVRPVRTRFYRRSLCPVRRPA